MSSLSKFVCQPQGAVDVALLSCLIAPTQDHDDRVAPIHKVDPIAWAMIDPHLTDAFANRLNVARIAVLQPLDLEKAIEALAIESRRDRIHFLNSSVSLISIIAICQLYRLQLINLPKGSTHG